jgi:hypothetical protein
MAPAHVALERPVIHEALVQGLIDALVVSGNGGHLAAEHCLVSSEHPNLLEGTDFAALAAVAGVEQRPAADEDGEVVRAVLLPVRAFALSVSSVYIHVAGWVLLELVEGGGGISRFRETHSNLLQDGRFGVAAPLGQVWFGRGTPEGLGFDGVPEIYTSVERLAAA